MKTYKKFLDAMFKGVGYLLAFLLAVAVTFVIIQVGSRYIFNDPTPWTEQASRYLFLWMMMLGLPVLFYRKISMAFDLILVNMPQGAQKIINLIFLLCSLVMSVFWLNSGMNNLIKNGARISVGLNIPFAWVYSAQPICAFLLILVFVYQILEVFQKKKGGIEG